LARKKDPLWAFNPSNQSGALTLLDPLSGLDLQADQAILASRENTDKIGGVGCALLSPFQCLLSLCASLGCGFFVLVVVAIICV
jgi:hypothetical protein